MAMVVQQVIWHGTQQESLDLVTAIAHNCTCQYGLMGVRLSTCPAHDAMIHNQRFLDGLLYVRHYWSVREPDAGKRVVCMERD